MTQTELNHAIARATGESITTIARMGFVPVADESIEHGLLVVDWDAMHAQQPALFPRRAGRHSAGK